MRSLLLVLSLFAATILHADEETGELTFDDLFRQQAIRHATLSSDGEHVAFFRHDTLVIGKPGTGYFDLRNFASRLTIDDVEWIGPKSVWVTSWDPANTRWIGSAISFRDLGDEGYSLGLVVDHFNPGYISDAVESNDNVIVLAKPRYRKEITTARLYKIDPFRELAYQTVDLNLVDTDSGSFFYYQKNSAGNYTLGVRLIEGVPEVWRRAPETGDWERVWNASKEAKFDPWQISDDAKTLWVLTNAETDRVVAAEFDLENRQFRKTLFEHDRVDVAGLIISEDGSVPIAAIYKEQGLYRYHFFSPEDADEYKRLEHHFPDMAVRLIGYTAGSDTRLVRVSSPSTRGSVHMCSLESDTCSLVESMAPWLDGSQLYETIPMSVPSTDGIVVEAFLTLPASNGDKVPLLAMPHGGPIGVSDSRYFSPDVQWLAHKGYAVIQVNFRGSGGYGEDFERAGLRQWGRGIEDDVEATVRAVIREYDQIDGDRVGIYGGSYGGYSALMSVIRNPELFKCAASFAGVTDLTLLFTQTRAMRNENLREILIEYIGDPNVDQAEQRQHSPVYRYRDIKRPVFLAHGKDDFVVDFEHSWRLQKMMRLAGTPPKFVLIPKVGHGFDLISEARKLYDPLLTFLDEHLMPVDPAQLEEHADQEDD